MDFLEYYRSNLKHLREMGDEFAREYPKIASRLNLDNLAYKDPFVERVLEASAFLAARVEKRLDESYLGFIETLLNSIAPHLLTSLPAFTVAKIDSTKLKRDLVSKKIEVGTRFEAKSLSSKGKIVFSTQYETIVSHFKISNVNYVTKSLEVYKPKNLNLSSALSFCLDNNNSSKNEDLKIEEDFLDVFINLPDEDAASLCFLLNSNLEQVLIEHVDGTCTKVDDVSIQSSYFSCSKNFIHHIAQNMIGALDLQLFLSYPDIFKFIRIQGINAILSLLHSKKDKVVFLFKHKIESLVHVLNDESLVLNCIGLFNLFEKRTSRVNFSDNHLCRLTADVSAINDYEIFSVKSLYVYNSVNQLLFYANPFYQTFFGEESSKINFFASHYRQRMTTDGQGRQSRRLVDLYVSIAGPDYSNYRKDINSLCADVWCTNGYKAKLLETYDILYSADEFEASVLWSPIGPDYGIIFEKDKDILSLISYIAANLSTFISNDEVISLNFLCYLIRTLSQKSEVETLHIIEGIKSFTVEKHMFRFISKGCVYFEQGYEVILSLSQKHLLGIGTFFFAQAIASVVKDFSAFNVPILFTLRNDESKEVCSWKL